MPAASARLLPGVTLKALFSLLFSAAAVWPQGSLGGVTGRVLDSTGAAIAGVSIRITNMDTGVELQLLSNSDGDYLASSLPPGRYRLAVSQSGFKTSVREPVIVSTATVSTLDFNLDVGDVAESNPA